MVKIMKRIFSGRWPILVLAVIALVLMLVLGVQTEQSPIRLAPLVISVGVMLLNSGANRYAFLAGGLNSILYGLSFLHYGLYGSMLQAFAISCPVQIATFFLWSKRGYKSSTVFRAMSARLRVLTAALSLVGYAGYLAVSLHIGASSPYVDSAIFISGIVLPILSLCSFREYAYIQPFTALLSPIVYITMLKENPDISVYLVYSIYSYVCIIYQLLSVRRFSKEQEGERVENA